MTAGVAAPAYAGIAVTHRDAASAVAFVAGHEDPSKDGSAIDWEALARFPGTLVFYMGVKNLPQIAERLVVSEHTVHRHVTNILRKLGLPSRTAAAVYAVRSGLLDGAAT